jgi:anti-sigma B factor antagonist
LDGFRLSSECRGDVVIVTIRGDLDMDTSRELDEHLTRARRERSRIILDLAGVDFLDTSSLAVIVGHWKKIEADGGTLALAGARYRYTKTLWVTGLASRIPLYESLEQAMAASETTQADGLAG